MHCKILNILIILTVSLTILNEVNASRKREIPIGNESDGNVSFKRMTQ